MYKQYFDEYCERLSTFNFLNWPYRDSKLKPSKMAQIGYFCHEDFLQCYSCQKKLIIDDLMLPGDVILERAFNLHESDCQAMAIKFKITQEFIHSYGMAYYDECLASWKDYIEVKKNYLDKVPNNFHFLIQNPKQVLAIFGWIRQDQFLLCKYCGRKCEILDEDFDVFYEHRYFCKWVNEGKNIKYGYLIVLQQLRDQSTQNKFDIKENLHQIDQDIVRKTLIQQSEEIISINLLRHAELQKAKMYMNGCQEQLVKRKRFDLQELEREREEFEMELSKKVKLQKEKIEEKNKERINLINSQISDQEEDPDIQENNTQQNQKIQNNHLQTQQDQIVIGIQQTIEEDNSNLETLKQQINNQINQSTSNLIQGESQSQQQDIQSQNLLKNNSEKVEQPITQFNQENKIEENQSIIQVPKQNENENVQSEQPEQPEIRKEEENKKENLKVQFNENFEIEQNNNLIIQNENQHQTDQKQQNLEVNNCQDQNQQNEILNQKEMVENNHESKLQNQEIEIEKEINEPILQDKQQEFNKENGTPKLIENQEINEVQNQINNNQNDKNQNQTSNDLQQINTFDKEEENKQQNKENNFIQFQADEFKEKNEQSMRNIPQSLEENQENNQRLEEENKIETIINLENQIAATQQDNQEIEQEQQVENINEIEVQENDQEKN